MDNGLLSLVYTSQYKDFDVSYYGKLSTKTSKRGNQRDSRGFRPKPARADPQ